MAFENLKSKQLPIRYSEEEGWALGEDDLNNHLKTHFDELRQSALAAKDISSKKMTIVLVMAATIAIMVSAMALAGAHLFAFVLALIAIADVAPILKFLDNSEK